jgi:predicted transcriptional regulator
MRIAIGSDDIFDALGDPTRRPILDLLRLTPRAAGEIASYSAVGRPAIIKHVGILKSAGLGAQRGVVARPT